MDELYIMQKDVNRTINEFLDFAKPRAWLEKLMKVIKAKQEKKWDSRDVNNKK
jgi:hypothetical protein